MTRVKRGVIAHKKREKLLKRAKGFRWGRKSKERAAKEALLHAGTHAFSGRKGKKRDYRRLWQVKINAAARREGVTYGSLMAGLKKSRILLDRKILADLAQNETEAFRAVLKLAAPAKKSASKSK